MFKKLLLYITYIIPLPLMAQHGDMLIAKHTFKFAEIEKHMAKVTVTTFITQNKSAFPAYTDTAIATQTMEELYSHLHFKDINNDGLDDVVFEGKDTAEGNVVKLFMNNGKSYAKVFEDKQGVTAMEFKNNILSKLQVSDWGCCGAYLNFERTYTISFSIKNKPAFTLVKQAAAVFDGAEPDSLFVEPFTASVFEYGIRLRSTPAVDDSSYTPWQVDSILRGAGNTIGILSIAADCMVIGTKAGNNKWWYVELNEDAYISRSVFYANSNKFPVKRRGWLPNNMLLP